MADCKLHPEENSKMNLSQSQSDLKIRFENSSRSQSESSSISSASQLGHESSLGDTSLDFDLPEVDDEYAIQFFGFSRNTFCNGIYNAFNSFLVDSLETLSDFLQQQFSAEMSSEQVKAGCETVRANFIPTMDKAFDKLEKYFESNLLFIPEHVLLDEDHPHYGLEPSEYEDTSVDEEIEDLTNKVWALKYANSELREELKTVEVAQNQSDIILDKFLNLQKLLKMSRVSDLRESLSFTLGKAYRSLELVNKLKLLAERPELQSDGQVESAGSPYNSEEEELIKNIF